MSVRRTDRIQSEPSDRRDPNAVAPSLANYEQFGPQLLEQRKQQLRNLSEKYKGVLGADKITAIVDIVQTLKEKHREKKGYSSISRDAELVFWQTAELYQWLGEHVRVVATSDYDDKRGVADYYVQKYDPDHPEKNFELLVDIAVGTGGKGGLAAKETPFAASGSLEDLRRIDPDRAELFELDGVRRKALLLQTDAVDVFPAYLGFRAKPDGTYEVGVKAPTIVVSLAEKEIDDFLKSIYSSEDKALKPDALSGNGLELSAFRKHTLERIHSAIRRQLAYLKGKQGSFSATAPDELATTKEALSKAEAYFFRLLSDVKKGIKGNRRQRQRDTDRPSADVSHTGAAATGKAREIIHPPVPERPILSLDELSKIAREAHETAQRALAIREKIAAIREQATKLTGAISTAQKRGQKLKTMTPFKDDTQRTGESLISRGLLWEHVPKNDRARMAQLYTEQMRELQKAVDVLSRIDAPSAEERRRLAEYQKTLEGVDVIVNHVLVEYDKQWHQKRDLMAKKIEARVSERIHALKTAVLDSLRDPGILARLQESHPDILEKIDNAVPGLVAQAQKQIEATGRGKEHQQDFFRKLVDRITAPEGGIDTYLTIQSELFGKLDSALSSLKQREMQGKQSEEASASEETSELWDAIDDYTETKNVNSPRLLDLKSRLLDIIAQDQTLPEGGHNRSKTLEHYLRIIQRMDYISFLATLQAFISELNTAGIFEKNIPDQTERRKIVRKVAAFIDNHDVLEALAGDVLEVASE